MKSTLFTVCVDNYLPDLMKFTLPNLERYAKRLGLDFKVITDRKFPDFPPTYEKMQIHELGKDNRWNLLVDADTMIHPQLPDLRTLISPECVGFNLEYDASEYFTPDAYFLRDGRRIGVVANLAVSSHLTHDFWTPLELSAEETKKRCFKRWYMADEFCLSRNLARFGLKRGGLLFGNEQHLRHFDATTSSPELSKMLEEAEQLSSQWI